MATLCVRRPSQAVSGAAAQLRVDAAAYSGQLHAAFAQLVRERCVERCKPCDLPRVAPRVSSSPPQAPTRPNGALDAWAMVCWEQA
jgi:hypothetical protein